MTKQCGLSGTCRHFDISLCLWLQKVTEVSVGIWIRVQFKLKIARCVKTPWQEHGGSCSLLVMRSWPRKARVLKSKSSSNLWKPPASTVWMKAISALKLSNSCRKIPKVRRKLENCDIIQRKGGFVLKQWNRIVVTFSIRPKPKQSFRTKQCKPR